MPVKVLEVPDPLEETAELLGPIMDIRARKKARKQQAVLDMTGRTNKKQRPGRPKRSGMGPFEDEYPI